MNMLINHFIISSRAYSQHSWLRGATCSGERRGALDQAAAVAAWRSSWCRWWEAELLVQCRPEMTERLDGDQGRRLWERASVAAKVLMESVVAATMGLMKSAGVVRVLGGRSMD